MPVVVGTRLHPFPIPKIHIQRAPFADISVHLYRCVSLCIDVGGWFDGIIHTSHSLDLFYARIHTAPTSFMQMREHFGAKIWTGLPHIHVALPTKFDPFSRCVADASSSVCHCGDDSRELTGFSFCCVCMYVCCISNQPPKRNSWHRILFAFFFLLYFIVFGRGAECENICADGDRRRRLNFGWVAFMVVVYVVVVFTVAVVVLRTVVFFSSSDMLCHSYISAAATVLNAIGFQRNDLDVISSSLVQSKPRWMIDIFVYRMCWGRMCIYKMGLTLINNNNKYIFLSNS